jgi:hypothetical protein
MGVLKGAIDKAKGGGLGKDGSHSTTERLYKSPAKSILF